jgi:hypothetical protein
MQAVENSDACKEKKKKKIPMCSKDLDNPTYGLFKRLGRYNKCQNIHILALNLHLLIS